MSQPAENQKSSALTNFRRKTVVSILRTWHGITGSARLAITGEVRPSLPKEDIEHLKKRMRECLNSKGGEVTARAHTIELGKTYLALNDTGKQRFLQVLAETFDLDFSALEEKMDILKKANGSDERSKAEQDLRDALNTPRSSILKQFNGLPDGFKFLVDLRSDLLPLVGKDPFLKGLEYDLKNILAAWFDIGLLDLVEISWNSPAALLEKLIAYEAVHKIKSWDDLKNRLDSDRRVFAFLHNKMALEPLIFVQVALCKGLAGSVQTLLDETSPVLDVEEADTAIFYSISNAQKGLAGIPFGNFLIKRVVDKLSREMPHVKHYSTLSPVPGFRAWLDPQLNKGEEGLLTAAEQKEIKALNKSQNAANALLELLSSDWHKDAKTSEKLKPMLVRLCAYYLLSEKKKKTALDPVAHFHLTNGARLERICWLADTSAKGFKQSAGLMVNYYYDLGDIDNNHETYVTDGKVVASRAVRGLV